MSLLTQRAYSHDTTQDRFLDKMQDHFVSHGFTCVRDAYGNLLSVRGTGMLPCVIAHVDIAQPVLAPSIVEVDGWVTGILNGIQKGVGHDDRAGVYFAQLIAESDLPCKIVLTKDEEVGAIGASRLPKKFFEEVSLCLQLDRRGASDISDYTNGVEVVSAEFKRKIKDLLKKHNYSFTTCMFTDVGELKAGLGVDFCCMNISCGYYSEHTHEERLNWNQFVNACRFAWGILNLCGHEKQHHVAVRRSYSSWSTKTKNEWWDYDPVSKKILFLGGPKNEEEEEEAPKKTPYCYWCNEKKGEWMDYWQAYVCEDCKADVTTWNT